jgi:hypothetical protein
MNTQGRTTLVVGRPFDGWTHCDTESEPPLVGLQHGFGWWLSWV